MTLDSKAGNLQAPSNTPTERKKAEGFSLFGINKGTIQSLNELRDSYETTKDIGTLKSLTNEKLAAAKSAVEVELGNYLSRSGITREKLEIMYNDPENKGNNEDLGMVLLRFTKNYEDLSAKIGDDRKTQGIAINNAASLKYSALRNELRIKQMERNPLTLDYNDHRAELASNTVERNPMTMEFTDHRYEEDIAANAAESAITASNARREEFNTTASVAHGKPLRHSNQRIAKNSAPASNMPAATGPSILVVPQKNQGTDALAAIQSAPESDTGAFDTIMATPRAAAAQETQVASIDPLKLAENNVISKLKHRNKIAETDFYDIAGLPKVSVRRNKNGEWQYSSKNWTIDSGWQNVEKFSSQNAFYESTKGWFKENFSQNAIDILLSLKQLSTDQKGKNSNA